MSQEKFDNLLSIQPAGALAFLCFVWCVVCATPVDAHWCSNIYISNSRIVILPERQQIDVPEGQTKELRVRVRNNFPFTLQFIALRANHGAELTVEVSPTEAEARNIRAYAGRTLTFVLNVHRNSAGSDDVSALNLQINTAIEGITEQWRDEVNTGPEDNQWMGGAPNFIRWVDLVSSWAERNAGLESELESITSNDEGQGYDQSHTLSYASCAELSACSIDSRTGFQKLLDEFNNPLDNLSRYEAGQALAIHLKYLPFTSPTRAEVVSAFQAALQNTNPLRRGMAAFYSAYGGNDLQAQIQSMADLDDDDTAKMMAKSALLMLGGPYENEIRTQCYDVYKQGAASHEIAYIPPEQNWSDLAVMHLSCCAGLAMLGEQNDDVITDHMLDHVGRGSDLGNNGKQEAMFGSMLLQLVAIYRQGGLYADQGVSFFNDEVVVDTVPPQAPQNLAVNPPN